MKKTDKKVIVKDSKNEIKAEVCNIEQSLCEIEFSESEYESGVLMRSNYAKVKGLSLESCHKYGKAVLREWKPRRKSTTKTVRRDYIG